MRQFLTVALLTLALCGLGSSCKSSKLEVGGAYAPGTNGVPAAQPDLAFFVADSAYDLAYSAIDAAFKFEKTNRDLLWKVSPEIKHALDRIRPQAVAVNAEYLKARMVYMANPIPANLTTLQSVLAKIQQLSAAAVAVLPKAK